MYKHTFLAIAIATLALSACGKDRSDAASGEEPQTLIGKAVEKATIEAREELAKGNIDLGTEGQPKAEITPQGDLLIDGRTVAINAEQRTLLLAYRKQIAGVAEAGIGIGAKGADLAGKAVGEAIKGVFSGETDQIEKKIEQEAKGIEAEAQKLCALLPGLKSAQDKLAASLPEFRPYAKMDDSDVEDCKIDHLNAHESGENVGHEIGRAINEAREEGDGMNAAEEAEAASERAGK